MDERESLIAICSFLPFGPVRVNLLVNYFTTAAKVWASNEEELINVGLKIDIVKEFVDYRKQFDSKGFFDKLNSLSVKVVTAHDSGYPTNLVGLDDSPLVLYVRGKILQSDGNAVSIVGSRKASYYGRDVTKKIASELSGYGVTIVSGLAFGIDLEAHRSSLEVGGRCIAVLASGIDMVTPKSNEWLGRKIIESGGAIVSEYPPGIIPQKHFFPYRNRIISGLSKAVIVVEGEIKSGTIHTANHAARQGRIVFGVPGQITSPNSSAPHYLIQNGARMLLSTKDVIDELNLDVKVNTGNLQKLIPSDKSESNILTILTSGELHIDEVARISSIPISVLSGKLTVMELKGMVKNIGGSIYKKI